LVAESRFTEKVPLHARQDMGGERARVDVGAGQIDEAEHDDFVAEEIVQVKRRAGGVQNFAVGGIAERRQLVAARCRCGIGEWIPTGG
jgi:hypothetical protein